MRFKKFLERYITNGDAEWQFMSKVSLPLTPTLLQSVEKNIDKAYHITDISGFKTLYKLQGKRKSISCFTIGSRGISQGAKTDGVILVKLQGKSSFYSRTDFYSKLDRTGTRWISKYGDVDGKLDSKDSVIYNLFAKVMEKKILKKYPIKNIDELFLYIKEMDRKEKTIFIKWYYSESKKIINKSFINSVIKKMELYGGHAHTYTNDELLLHNFKILNVYIVFENVKDKSKEYRKIKATIEDHNLVADIIQKNDIRHIEHYDKLN